MKHLTTTIIILAAVVCAGCGGNAEREQQGGAEKAAGAADGEITATLNGETRTWYVLSRVMGGQRVSQSEWTSAYGDGTYLVTLFGHSAPDSISSSQGFMLDFTAVASGGGARVTDPTITYLSGESLTQLHNTDAPGRASVEVTSLDVQGDVLTVSGTFSGQLVPSAGNQGADAITVSDGTFRATIQPPSG